MAVIVKLPSGAWRVQVRRKKIYSSKTFIRHSDATSWALETERAIDQGLDLKSVGRGQSATFGEVIDLHIKDMQEIGKPLGRSKNAVLAALKKSVGKTALKNMTRETLISYGKRRAKLGAGPATLAIDFSFISTVLTHAAALYGIATSTEEVKLARVALSRLGIIGKSNERDRRPTQQELDLLIQHFEAKPRQLMPMARIIRFAVATAMRLGEICAIDWEDVNFNEKMIIVRNRKDPRRKEGNHQKIPMLSLTGYDAWQVIIEQSIVTHRRGRVFPHHHKSAGTAFHRVCDELGILDLHFHDLRHEATSRLFEVGLSIERVALVTGHKDWKMLRRYTNLKPEQLHQFKPARPVAVVTNTAADRVESQDDMQHEATAKIAG